MLIYENFTLPTLTHTAVVQCPSSNSLGKRKFQKFQKYLYFNLKKILIYKFKKNLHPKYAIQPEVSENLVSTLYIG